MYTAIYFDFLTKANFFCLSVQNIKKEFIFDLHEINIVNWFKMEVFYY